MAGFASASAPAGFDDEEPRLAVDLKASPATQRAKVRYENTPMASLLHQGGGVITASAKASACPSPAQAVTFTYLWQSYVTGNPYRDPTTGSVPPGFGNQCAIRLSATLHRVGVEMKSFTPANVTVKPGNVFGRILLDGKYTAVRADQMGSWLARRPFCGLPARPEDVTGRDWEAKVRGRTGIIAFDGYWARPGESPARASGGHIDLWNGSRMTNNGVLGTLLSFSRFSLGVHDPWVPLYSDLRDSKTILFFEIK